MKIAITRGISPRFTECELTHLERAPIDIALARAEHAGYLEALRSIGLQVVELPALEDHPDCVFVEDVAVALPECALITRPGAESRRGEVPGIKAALAHWRSELLSIEAPGTLDGGDVLVSGKSVYIGRSSRSNTEGIRQAQHLLGPFGYHVHPVDVTGCLHLKSAVCAVAPGVMLLNPAWVDASVFADHEIITVDPAEPDAANALLIDTHLVYARHHPRTGDRLRRAGIQPVLVDAAEIARAEGAVTCCSIVFDANRI